MRFKRMWRLLTWKMLLIAALLMSGAGLTTLVLFSDLTTTDASAGVISNVHSRLAPVYELRVVLNSSASVAFDPLKINADVKMRAGFSEPPPAMHTQFNDIFISIKTTATYHEERLDAILRTWYREAKNQTYIFTDKDDPKLMAIAGDHVINTKCSATHSRWFCHVDDDTYVNVGELVNMLSEYKPNRDWYIGRPSLSHPMSVMHWDNVNERFSFWFATGGAGLCLSRGLALKLFPFIGLGKFISMCYRMKLPDDCTMGAIVAYYLKKELTVVDRLHSHLESMHQINSANLAQQITMSYSTLSSGMRNAVNVDLFNVTVDPTRFFSVHCVLLPDSHACRDIKHWLGHE